MIQNKREYYLAMTRIEELLEEKNEVGCLKLHDEEELVRLSAQVEEYEEVLYPMPMKEDEDEERGRVIALHECAEKLYAVLDIDEAYDREAAMEAIQAYKKWREGDTVDTSDEVINRMIKHCNVDASKISDGYHTIAELYEHRNQLWIALCRYIYNLEGDRISFWKTKHGEGYFLLGVGIAEGNQMTYHLPMKHWEECSFAIEREVEYDGHTSNDVLQRIKRMVG